MAKYLDKDGKNQFVHTAQVVLQPERTCVIYRNLLIKYYTDK
jgi:hypothetical protein